MSLFLLAPKFLVGIVCAYCILGATLAWLLFQRWTRIHPDNAPQPAFHTPIITVFALVLSFTLSDGWKRNDTAYGALLRESHEIAAMLPLLDALQGANKAATDPARAELRHYLDLSLREEWAAHNTVPSAGAGAALDGVRNTIAQRLLDPAPQGAVWRMVLDRLDAVQQARNVRLVAGGLYGDLLRWGALAALYWLGACGIAMVHVAGGRLRRWR